MVTQEQVDFFQENGYLKFGRVLDSDGVEAMRAGLDGVIELELTKGDDSSPEFKYGHDRRENRLDRGSGHPRAIHQYVNMWKRDPHYEAAIHHSLIAGTARALLDTPEVRLWHDQVISKPPEDNGHFAFHHDFFFWPLSPPNIVSCWLALDDATVDSGCMHVMPKSHKDERFSVAARAAANAAAAKARQEGRELPSRPVGGKTGVRHQSRHAGGTESRRVHVSSLPQLPRHATECHGRSTPRLRHDFHGARRLL